MPSSGYLNTIVTNQQQQQLVSKGFDIVCAVGRMLLMRHMHGTFTTTPMQAKRADYARVVAVVAESDTGKHLPRRLDVRLHSLAHSLVTPVRWKHRNVVAWHTRYPLAVEVDGVSCRALGVSVTQDCDRGRNGRTVDLNTRLRPVVENARVPARGARCRLRASVALSCARTSKRYALGKGCILADACVDH